jgi:membrane protein DedA with SNARE-associated domain
MMPFNLALEANNLGKILDLVLALIILVALGLVLVIGVESKSTLVIRGFLHTQNIIECGFPFMMLFQVFSPN